jgi:hypothetical protein
MSSIEGFTPENIRDNALPRMFLVRSLATRMALRLQRAEYLVARAHETQGDERIFAWMAALSTTWTLVENTLKLYETIAEQIDTRYEGKRRGLDTRFQRERTGDERVAFHRRVWMFSMFEHVPDSAFANIGFEPSAARRLIDDMIERSITYLAASEETMRTFFGKYKAVMNAHKHGRALFAFTVTLEQKEDDPTTTRGSLVASVDAVTALVSEKPGQGAPTQFITISADDELIGDVETVFAILATQLPKFREFLDALSDGTAQFLAFLEQSPDAQRPTIPFSFFAEPYSSEEAALLSRIREHSLRF